MDCYLDKEQVKEEVEEVQETKDKIEDIRKCIIIGQSNRYQIKKLTTERSLVPKTRKKVTQIGEEQFDHSYEEQFALLENYETTNLSKVLVKEIETKVNGYKQQDIEKNMWNAEHFITTDHIIHTLQREKLLCHYCRDKMLVLYKNVREPKQWTVDRVNNDQGHNQDNYVVACLKCNLSRRRTNKDKFLFTKQLKIVRV